MALEKITLNLIPTGETPTIHAAQFDKERAFQIELKEGEDDFSPTGYTIELQVRKVDNNIVTAIPSQVSGNIVTFLTTEQMTACSGTNLAELQISKDNMSIATLHFYLVVQRDVLAGGLSSQSEIYDLEDQIAAIVPEVIGDEYYTADQVDEKIAEIPTFDPTNYYDKTQLYTKTETNGLLSQKANMSSLSTVATSGSYDDLSDKPTIPGNASVLPISASDSTNTKDYIDSINKIKVFNTIYYQLNKLTWLASGGGKYYALIDLISALPSGANIVGITINYWSGIRINDFFIPSISSTQGKFNILSNVNTFASNDSALGFRILYI